MSDSLRITSIASLLGDTTRSGMLCALMDGRALTATELALEGAVAPSTASVHLTKLVSAGLLSVVKRGRHRHFRIAGPDVASVLEGLAGLAQGERANRPPVLTGPRDAGMRRARVCYDHLAGTVAVQLLGRLRSRNFVDGPDQAPELTPVGAKWIRRLGIDLDELTGRRRPLCRACLDWSERRTHLAGAIGAALLDRMFVLRLARREPASRAVLFAPRGEAFLERLEVTWRT